MKRQHASVILAGWLAVGLAACSSTPMSSDTSSAGGTSSPSADVTSGSPASGSAYNGTGSPSPSGSTGNNNVSATDGGASASTGMAGATSTQDGASARAGMAGMPGTPAMSGPSISASGTANSVVMLIEPVPRQGGPGSSSIGGTGSAGSSNSSSGGGASGGMANASDKSYRVTVRMDDGSNLVVTQDWAPSYRIGDRVRASISGNAAQ